MLEISKEKIQERFEYYVETVKKRYDKVCSGEDYLFDAGETTEAFQWLKLFGVDLNYFRIKDMIDGKIKILAFEDVPVV